MTLALLQDSGWYQVTDYSLAATKLVKGVMYGYQDGCELLMDKCVTRTDSGTNSLIKLPSNPHIFEEVSPLELLHSRCTPDGMSSMNHAEYLAEYPHIEVPAQYHYGHMTSKTNRDMDFCPSFVSQESCAKQTSNIINTPDGFRGYLYANRCTDLEVAGKELPTLIGTCDTIVSCNEGSSSYEVIYLPDSNLLGTCSHVGQRIAVSGSNVVVICLDPALVCAELYYPHIPFSNINEVPRIRIQAALVQTI